MQELSLNILDIAQNSIAAGASLVTIKVTEDIKKDLLTIIIADDGKGMDEEFLKTVTDPFSTTRTTRKVGLGIPFFKMASECAGGTFHIASEKGKGTAVTATFQYSHIDRMPLGDIAGTLSALISASLETDFLYIHSYNNNSFTVDTRELKQILGDIPLNNPEVARWVTGFIQENLNNIYGG